MRLIVLLLLAAALIGCGDIYIAHGGHGGTAVVVAGDVEQTQTAVIGDGYDQESAAAGVYAGFMAAALAALFVIGVYFFVLSPVNKGKWQ